MTSPQTAGANDAAPRWATAALVLADGAVFWGKGIGAARHAVGEVCFNTSMTGYQEIITDPSYAGQIITFTFPHIGNVGTNPEDIEALTPFARGVVIRGDITEPSNWRSAKHLDDWLKSYNLPGICGVDTRAITRRIRDKGPPNGVVVHAADGKFDIPAMRKMAQDWPGLDGMDLAIEVTTKQTYSWDETKWALGKGYGKLDQAQAPRGRRRLRRQAQHPALPRQHRLQGDGGAGDGDGRRHPAPQARRRVPVERPGRSGRDGRLRGAGDPGRARQGRAAVRHLPRPSASRPHPRRQDAQDGARPSRRQPAGQGPDDRQGRDHLAEPRLLRRSPNRCPRTPR